jgi:hypothetical protein
LLYRSDAPLGDKWTGALPNIKGRVDWLLINDNVTVSGAFTAGKNVTANVQGSYPSAAPRYIDFDAHRSSSIYADDTLSVHPRSINIYQIIKY